jgi:hypothetical protein
VAAVEFRPRFWKKLLPTASQQKPEQPLPAAECANGWNRLPPELVDEILGYLSEDIPSLKACSLTCKVMLASARPLIGSWLYLIPPKVRRPKGRFIKSLLKRPKEGSDALERLIAADRQGRLRHIRHLVIGTGELALIPHSLQSYVPYFLSISNLRTLVIDSLDVSAFMPLFDDCLEMFTHSLRSLDVRHVWDSERELLLFISQFPLLEDLSIRSCYAIYSFLGPSPLMVRTSPPFRGHLNLSFIMDSQSLCEAMVQLPGGLHFTSLELKGCREPVAILTACQFTLRSVSYTWTTVEGEHSSPSRCSPLDDFSVAGRALDLKDNSVLERFEFKASREKISAAPSWLYRTLWKINSPAFKEFVISISNCSNIVDLREAVNGGDWRSVDAYLCVLVRFQPGFRVVFRVGFEGDEGVIRGSLREPFPLASKKGFIKIERVRQSGACVTVQKSASDVAIVRE